MGGSIIRILVVDDFEPWRHFVASTFRLQPELQIICQVSDGLEAVRKAEELQPDLVLLDIGLPTLNGIEVAREIAKLSPECKIIFLTENRSSDLIEEAFRAGASGYVIKSNAANELVSAVKAALKTRIV
jgi:DNA-binding NarL/FixJ family response regulator